MIDLRMYKPSGVYLDARLEVEQMERVVPDDSTATSIEVIAGKVIKYMLTQKGTDAFNPEYGGISMHYQQMSYAFFPQFKREVNQDVANCENFIKQAEIDASLEGEKLYKINVLKIVYDYLHTPDRVDVYLEIITTYGKHACVAITNRTNS